MTRALLAMLAVAFLLAAEEKKPDDVKAKLNGVWNYVSIEVGGKKDPEDEVAGRTVTFDGDTLTDEIMGEKGATLTYKIDASKKPAEMDVTHTDGPNKGTTTKYIFFLENDTLNIGFGGADFDNVIGIITLKREKK